MMHVIYYRFLIDMTVLCIHGKKEKRSKIFSTFCTLKRSVLDFLLVYVQSRPIYVFCMNMFGCKTYIYVKHIMQLDL